MQNGWCLTQDSLERVRIRRIKIDWEGKNRGTGYLFMEAEKFHSAICKLENQESMAEHKSKGSEKPMMCRPADDQSLGVLGWMLYPNAEFQCFFCSVLPTCHFPSIEGWSSVTYFINSHANLRHPQRCSSLSVLGSGELGFVIVNWDFVLSCDRGLIL